MTDAKAKGAKPCIVEAPDYESSVGKGTVSGYAEFAMNGAPKTIGIVFQAGAPDGLPSAPSDGHHCFDRDTDGKGELDKESIGTHERVIR